MGIVEMSADRFEQLVADALDAIPEDLARMMDNVVVVVSDRPSRGGMLGLYEGVPLTERAAGYDLVLPDRITLYRRPILEQCADEDDVVHEVLVTVVHEVAHHFGIDDDRLAELGWA
jgi:predicted Zn-dependent protease with MMP-like domain